MPERIERLSPDVVEDRLARLKELVPEAFADGVLDLRGLAAALWSRPRTWCMGDIASASCSCF